MLYVGKRTIFESYHIRKFRHPTSLFHEILDKTHELIVGTLSHLERFKINDDKVSHEDEIVGSYFEMKRLYSYHICKMG